MMIMIPLHVLLLAFCIAQGNLVEGGGYPSGSYHLKAIRNKAFSGKYNETDVTNAPALKISNGKQRKISLDDLKNRPFVVIQRRINGRENFARPLRDYQVGFGNPQGDYWAGLDAIYKLTHTGYNVLRVDLSDWAGNRRYGIYSYFAINDHTDKYRLHLVGYNGNVPDDMTYQNSMVFCTYDYPDVNDCATKQQVGWWYNYCAYALLNGHYYPGGHYAPHGSMYDGVYWKDWTGYDYSLKFVTMTLYGN